MKTIPWLASIIVGTLIGSTIKDSQAEKIRKINSDRIEVNTTDQNCAKFANFAKSLATLKEVGFTADGTKQFVTEPVVSPYPVHLVRSKVYSMTETPEEVYKHFYVKCTFIGYDSMVKLFVDEEAIVKENIELKKELAQVKAMVAETANLTEKMKSSTKTVKK